MYDVNDLLSVSNVLYRRGIKYNEIGFAARLADRAFAAAIDSIAPTGGEFQGFRTEVRSAQSPAGTGVAPALRPPSLCRFSS